MKKIGSEVEKENEKEKKSFCLFFLSFPKYLSRREKKE